MTALQALRELGKAPATDIAHRAGLGLVAVYAELVRAEACGYAAVRCSGQYRHGSYIREWVAITKGQMS